MEERKGNAEKNLLQTMSSFHCLGKVDNSSWIFWATTLNSTGFVFATSLNMKSHSGGFCNIIASVFVDKDVTTYLAWPEMGG